MRLLWKKECSLSSYIAALILLCLMFAAIHGPAKVLVAAGTCVAPSFLPASGINVGISPQSVAVGEFNKDGKLDMAVANSGSGTVSILLGNGDGLFLPVRDFPAGKQPNFVVVGDFNGDGKADLAVTNFGTTVSDFGNVSILLGGGDGTFQAPVSYPADKQPDFIAIADFNGDGKPDLAVANQQSGNLSIFLGNGDGTFRAVAGNALQGQNLYSVASGDFNGDGIADLAVATFNFELSAVSILLGQGNGTFRIATSFPTTGSFPIYVAVGDFNKDGKADLAVTLFGDLVSIFLGIGDGTFKQAVQYDVGHSSSNVSAGSITVGDFNGDGKPDLAVTSFGPDENLSILLGRGDGSFQSGINYSASTVPSSSVGSVAAGDFNSDGKLDLVVTNGGDSHNPSMVSLLINSCGICLPITVSPATVPAGSVGRAYNPPTITASSLGGPAQFQFSITAGGLAPGLSLQTFGSSAIIAGAPASTGTFSFTVTATDANGCSRDQNYALSVGSFVPGDPSLSISLPAGSAQTNTTIGKEGPVQGGYGIVELGSGNAPYGTAVFSLTQNGVVVAEAGVPVSPPTTAARIFIDYRASVSTKSESYEASSVNVNTGLAIVNASSLPAAITYLLRDVNGQALAQGQERLPAGAHRAKFISEFRDLAPEFTLPPDFSTAIQFGSLEITSDQAVSVVALRLTTNQRSETLITTTPVADLTKTSTARQLFFPHMVDGGGFKTTIILLNTTGVPESGSFRFYDDQGSALSVHPLNGAAGSVFPYQIPPNGVFIFQTDDSPQTVNAGSIQLTADANSSTPEGAGIFGFTQVGVLVTESGIPAAAPTTHARIYVDKSAGHDTGLAIAAITSTASKDNLEEMPVPPVGLSFRVDAFQADGITLVNRSLTSLNLNFNGHLAKFVGQLISGLPDGFTGILDITSLPPDFSSPPKPFVALTLRSLTNSRGDFLLTTFPVADFNQPAPAPLVFPQIADGGGYQTQFILLNTGGSTASINLNLFGDDGSGLAVGKSSR